MGTAIVTSACRWCGLQLMPDDDPKLSEGFCSDDCYDDYETEHKEGMKIEASIDAELDRDAGL